MNLKKFSFKERIMFSLGVFPFLNQLVDKKIIRKDLHYSPLFKRNTLQLLIKHYGGSEGHNINKTTGNLGFGLTHYSMINSLGAKRILCIGSEMGFIPAICALACKDRQVGHVDFVDAGKSSRDKHDWGGIGFWKNKDLKEHFSVLGLDSWITPHIMTTKEFARKNSKNKWDYIYIDGDHSYQGAKTDYELFWPKLVSGGYVSLHDIDLKGLYHGEEFGVWKLWQELDHKHTFRFGSGGSAVGFIQKESLAT